MKKKTTTLRLVSLTLVVFFSLTGAALAQGRLVPKVDNFILLIDKSGSMFLTQQGAAPTKAELAKGILLEMNKLIPELGYIGAIQSFPPSKTLLGPKRYDRNSFAKGIESLPVEGTIFGNQTPLGTGILDLGEVLKEMPRGKTAVIICSPMARKTWVLKRSRDKTACEQHTAIYHFTPFPCLIRRKKEQLSEKSVNAPMVFTWRALISPQIK